MSTANTWTTALTDAGLDITEDAAFGFVLRDEDANITCVLDTTESAAYAWIGEWDAHDDAEHISIDTPDDVDPTLERLRTAAFATLNEAQQQARTPQDVRLALNAVAAREQRARDEVGTAIVWAVDQQELPVVAAGRALGRSRQTAYDLLSRSRD